ALLQEGGRLAFHGSTDLAIKKDIVNSGSRNVEKVWTTTSQPSNSNQSIRAIRARGQDDLKDQLFTNTEISLEVEFSVVAPKAKVGVTIVLYDSEGTCVFSSINNRGANYNGPGLPSGTYRSTVLIPRNFLNDGAYS